MGGYQEIRDQAYGFFIQEAPELLQTLEAELLLLRTEPTKTRVHNLMRAAHSIKGGAANVGLMTIQSLAHRLEDCFRCFYNEALVLTPDLEQLLLQGCDHLRDTLMEAIELGEAFDGETALRAAEPVFAQIEIILEEFLQTEEELPTLGDSGIDMTRTVFEGDVATALDRLEQVATDPFNPMLAGELRAQAEVFVGLGELFSFPWLTEMARIILKALDHHPRRAHEILTLALADFRRAQQTVLSGHGSEGIPTSAPLQEFAASEDLPIPDMSLSTEDLFLSEESLSQQQESQFCPEDVFLLGTETEYLPEDIFSVSEEAVEMDPVFELVDPPEKLDHLDHSPIMLSEEIDTLLQELPKLPIIEIESPPISPQKPKPIPSFSPPYTSNSDLSSSISVRLELARLEQMNNQLGELVILQNKLVLQNEQLQTSLQTFLHRFSTFAQLGKQLRLQMDRVLLSPELITQGKRQGRINDMVMGFDTLELDSYDEAYALLQAAVDQIGLMEENIGDLTLFVHQSSRDLEQQRQQQNTLRNQLMWARMMPLGDILNRLPRVLRDLCHQKQKPAELTLSGTSVLVDKAILEKLYVPITHLIRNAFDHGIEDPETRQQAHKPLAGQIGIRAYYRGSRTLIEISDDGRGIDLEKVKQKALATGLLSVEEATYADAQQVFELLFEPDFSTADTVTELSGRGMGLDIVRSQIQALKGTVSITSTPGLGTTFTLCLPLTLRISQLVLLWTGTSMIAIPSDTIEEIVIPQPQHLTQSASQRFLHWRERAIPIYQLQALLSYPCSPSRLAPPDSLRSVPTPDHWLPPLLVMRQGSEYCALEVEQLLTEQELVIKPFSPTLPYPSYLYGCTIVGDGTLVPVVDGIALLSQHLTEDTLFCPPPMFAEIQISQPLIQIVDDSIAMRQTLTLTLEKAGYRVLAARQGREALEQLHRHLEISLVICDIEMPLMNGFEFLIQKREDPNLNRIPVVMLTSRSGEKHRKLALKLGAVNYFTKPYIESQLLQEINQILIPIDI